MGLQEVEPRRQKQPVLTVKSYPGNHACWRDRGPGAGAKRQQHGAIRAVLEKVDTLYTTTQAVNT
jgi:hypothetical protein